MKKSIFTSVSAAALMFSASTVAQNNTSSVTQSGSGQDAAVTQTGSDSGSTVTQSGNGNEADLVQSGINQTSLINQTGTGGVADVNQSGEDNDSEVQQTANADAKVVQSGENTLGGFSPDAFPNNRSFIRQGADGAMADVSQSGTLNRSSIEQDDEADATVMQTGTYNNSTIDQNAGSAGAIASVIQGGDYGDNRSAITQNGASTATVYQFNVDPVPFASAFPGNESDITQSGADNVADIDQSGDDNSSDVLQSGDGSIATTTQRGTDNASTVNQADNVTSNVEQGVNDASSSGNTATVNQNLGSDGSISDINQDGNANTTLITQNGANSDSFAYTTGNNNVVDVVQNGSDSVSIAIQRDFIDDSSTSPATGNRATVRQNGNETYSYVAQDGGNNVAEVTLNGEGERTAGRQTTSAGYVNNEPAESVVLQIGEANKAFVTQIADRAESNVYQGTTFNGSTVFLANGSNNNVANINQNAGGDNSRSDVFQGGEFNTANTMQAALDGFSDVRQDGVGNSSSVDQQSGAGHDAIVEQYADGNTSTITQNGTDNFARVGQYSDGNTSIVDQGGSGNTATVTQGPGM